MRRPLELAALVLAACGFAAPPVRAASSSSCTPADPSKPRTLIVALDGIPYRVVERARELGAFAGWPETKPLVSTFPSMTNVGFTALLAPLGADPIAGYELRRYERERNGLTSRRKPDGVNRYNWVEAFQVMEHSLWDKAWMFLTPRSHSRREMKRIEEFVLESAAEVMLGYIGGTDPYVHFHRDEKSAGLVLELAQRLEALKRLHVERFGRPLHVVLFSDHGNHQAKIKPTGGLTDVLRQAGLDPSRKLRDPDDVVAVTYGVVGYGVLFVARESAERAALAMLSHDAVELVAWRRAERELVVASHAGRAVVRWEERLGDRAFAYEIVTGDPLRLAPAVAALRQEGALDAQGLASHDAWFDRTALGDFPDAPARIVEAFVGTWVRNPADVLVSFRPGRAWGTPPARWGAALLAGRLEATHGGLDRESTLGFYLSSEGRFTDQSAVRADRALVEFRGAAACMASLPLHLGCSRSTLHAARVVAP